MKNTKIIVRKVVHRGQARVALIFDYDKEVISQVKRIPGVKWSKTMGCWHAPPDVDLSRYLGAVMKRPGVKGKKKFRSEKKVDPIGGHNRLAIDEFIKWMSQRRYSQVTMNHYRDKVLNFFSVMDKKWEEVSVEDIERFSFKYYVKHGRGRSGQNMFLSALKLFYKSNQSEVLVPNDIKRPRSCKRLPQVLSLEEVRDILGTVANIKHKTLLMLIYSGGLRIGETLALRLEDINEKRRVIEIHSGKGAKDRQVPLSRKIIAQLKIYYEAYKPKVYVFEGMKEGRPYSSRSAQQVLKAAVKKAGIRRRVTLHTLRHSYATHLMEKGVGLRYIQDILGHRSPKTTMVYTHVSGRKLRDVTSPLDDMDL